jgi:hypothetical protein
MSNSTLRRGSERDTGRAGWAGHPIFCGRRAHQYYDVHIKLGEPEMLAAMYLVADQWRHSEPKGGARSLLSIQPLVYPTSTSCLSQILYVTNVTAFFFPNRRVRIVLAKCSPMARPVLQQCRPKTPRRQLRPQRSAVLQQSRVGQRAHQGIGVACVYVCMLCAGTSTEVHGLRAQERRAERARQLRRLEPAQV